MSKQNDIFETIKNKNYGIQTIKTKPMLIMKLSTPILDLKRDQIIVYLISNRKQIYITDDGWIVDDFQTIKPQFLNQPAIKSLLQNSKINFQNEQFIMLSKLKTLNTDIDEYLNIIIKLLTYSQLQKSKP